MSAAVIVIRPPCFDEGLCLGERGELVHVQALITEPPVKRFNKRAFHGLAAANEVEQDTPPIDLIFERPGLEFGPMIHRNRTGHYACAQHTIEHLTDRLSRHPNSYL